MYEKASINQIIKEADISRGSFYQYFEDKDDLYFFLIDTVIKTTSYSFLKEFVAAQPKNVFSVYKALLFYNLQLLSDAKYQAFFKNMTIQLSDHFTYGKLIKFTIPSIVMMIFTSIYSVVDGLFVSNFAGKTAFSAVNLMMPIFMIIATVGFMFGTGGTAIVANTFGAGDKEKANRYFSLFVYVAFALGVLFAIIGFAFIRPIATLIGAKGQLLEYCVDYGRIILAALPFFVLQLLFQSFFVAAERPHLGLLVSGVAGVTNMVLDAVLVILLPQEYKLAGAAVATAFSQFLGGVIPLVYFLRKNTSILRLGKTNFDGRAIVKACTNGSSEFMSNISMQSGRSSTLKSIFNIGVKAAERHRQVKWRRKKHRILHRLILKDGSVIFCSPWSC